MEFLPDPFCKTGFQSLLSQFILCLALLHLRCRIYHLDLLNFIPLTINFILFHSWGINTHLRLHFHSSRLFHFTQRSLGMRHFSTTESQNFGGKQTFPAWILRIPAEHGEYWCAALGVRILHGPATATTICVDLDLGWGSDWLKTLWKGFGHIHFGSWFWEWFWEWFSLRTLESIWKRSFLHQITQISPAPAIPQFNVTFSHKTLRSLQTPSAFCCASLLQ